MTSTTATQDLIQLAAAEARYDVAIEACRAWLGLSQPRPDSTGLGEEADAAQAAMDGLRRQIFPLTYR